MDGEPKIAGATRYTADYGMPGMLWGKCLRSRFAHACYRMTVGRCSETPALSKVPAECAE